MSSPESSGLKRSGLLEDVGENEERQQTVLAFFLERKEAQRVGKDDVFDAAGVRAHVNAGKLMAGDARAEGAHVRCDGVAPASVRRDDLQAKRSDGQGNAQMQGTTQDGVVSARDAGALQLAGETGERAGAGDAQERQSPRNHEQEKEEIVKGTAGRERRSEKG